MPAGRQLTVVVRLSEDDGATWSSAASVVVDEGSRSATSEVNVTIPAGDVYKRQHYDLVSRGGMGAGIIATVGVTVTPVRKK